MVTIPRDEIHAIAKRHGVDYGLDFDPSLEWVRATAALMREESPQFPSTPELRAEAAALDALADRYEREAA
jgi:hypothetical protein